VKHPFFLPIALQSEDSKFMTKTCLTLQSGEDSKVLTKTWLALSWPKLLQW
jgi:hypothetical protein